MTTIENTVKIWDKENPKMKTEILQESCGNIRNGKIYNAYNKEAIIRLSSDFKFEPWNERIGYIFGYKHNLHGNITNIYISFERRTKYDNNTPELYRLLEGFKILDDKPIVLSFGRINPNHLILKMELDINSTSEDICNYMKKFIDLTQKKIVNFLKGERI